MSQPRSFANVFDSPVSRLSFCDLLAALQELLSVELDVAIYLPEASFTVGFRARLLRVVELPPDHEAITLVFESGQAVTLAPEEVIAFSGCSEHHGVFTRWIEAQILGGPCVLMDEIGAGG